MDDATLVAPDSWALAIAWWLGALAAAGRPRTTLELRRGQLERLGRFAAPVGPWELLPADLVAFVASRRWERETLRSFRSAVRGFYSWGVSAGYAVLNPALALPAVKPADPNPSPAPEHVYRAALVKADARERLMLRLAAELGMRRAEVAVSHIDDLVQDVRGAWALTVHGKGARIRRLPLPPSLAAEIRRGTAAGYLFPGQVGGGHLSPRWVGKLVGRLMPGAWTMHNLRHRFATAAAEIDHDLAAVQELLGHSSIETTRRYVYVEPARLRRLVEAVSAL